MAATPAAATPASSAEDVEPPLLTGRVDIAPMDGNCLFHAALSELMRLQKNADVRDAHALRLRLIEWVAAHGEKAECADLTLAQWIELETEESLSAYVSRLRRNGQWGGIVELYALTEVYDVVTCVWEPHGRTADGDWRYTRRHALEGTSSRRAEQSSPDDLSRTVHLHYDGSSHYSVFVPDDAKQAASQRSARATAPLPAPAAAEVAVAAPSAAPAAAALSDAAPPPQSVTPPQSSQWPRAPSRVANDASGSVMSTAAGPSGAVNTRLGGAHRPVKSARPSSSSSSSSGGDGARVLTAAATTSRRTVVSTTARRPRPPMHAPLPTRTLPLPSHGGSASSSRAHHLTSHRSHASTRRPATLSAKRPFPDLSHAVKLSFRLERGAGLPRPREVRV